MRLPFFAAIFLIFSSISFSQSVKEYSQTDKAKLNDLPIKWAHYWNTHLMDSMGTMLKDDVDFVNVAGTWMKGKTATVADHKQKHLGIVFKNSSWTTDSIAIKYVKPDLAIIHISWGLSGDNDPDGTPRKPRHGIFTWVVVKGGSGWKILAAQNTNKREA